MQELPDDDGDRLRPELAAGTVFPTSGAVRRGGMVLTHRFPRIRLSHATTLSLLALMLAGAFAPAAIANHVTNTCDPTTGVCVRFVAQSVVGNVVPQVVADPTSSVHVGVGTLRVDAVVNFVEVAFVAVSVTSPGAPPDWSRYTAGNGAAGTSFTPNSVSTSSLDASPRVGSPEPTPVQLWNGRWQVWQGSQKLLDVPGFACTC